MKMDTTRQEESIHTIGMIVSIKENEKKRNGEKRKNAVEKKMNGREETYG